MRILLALFVAQCALGGAAVEERWFRADALFAAMPKPGPNDWLARYNEPGMTFDQYTRSDPVRCAGARRVIAVQPLGALTPEEQALLKKMCRYTEIFFGCPARLEPAAALSDEGRREREGRAQYMAPAQLARVLTPRLPPDAVCSLGVTVEDLYPDAKWNYCFGLASFRDRVGVFSLARYRPEFFGEKPGPDTAQRVQLRAVKVMVHETGHMFGLPHCRVYRCVMNGSNHLQELDASPVFLCPDCLRKLHWNLGFDIEARYRKMLLFWEAEGFAAETAWLQRRLAR
jgi:archaemetzincin